MSSLAARLSQTRSADLYRTRHLLDGPQGVEVTIDGRRCTAFTSNDYLGLASHPEVVNALRAGAARYGVGAGASHLVSGHHRAHEALEEALAAFAQRPRALLFSTGYMANLGVVTALAGRPDAVFEDRLNHASLIDAALLSRARLRRYRHRDVHSLAQQLDQEQSTVRLIASDGVFSMDGDLAPVPALADMAQARGAWLMIDDAHGMGVLGRSGRGVVEHFDEDRTRVPVLMGTLGKAFGTFGAFVAGDDDLIETLIQGARTYIYTTALPPAIAHATLTSLRLAQDEPWRREHLCSLVKRFRAGAEQLGLPLTHSMTPIQPIIIGDAAHALRISEALLQQGLLVTAIRPPTVPRNTSRLRVTLSAAHSDRHVDRLLSALADVL